MGLGLLNFAQGSLLLTVRSSPPGFGEQVLLAERFSCSGWWDAGLTPGAHSWWGTGPDFRGRQPVGSQGQT